MRLRTTLHLWNNHQHPCLPKNGLNINELLEKVLLEAELLELKANPEKNARGTIIEATLDKGRGYTTTLLVQSGTLAIGDIKYRVHTGLLGRMHDTDSPVWRPLSSGSIVCPSTRRQWSGWQPGPSGPSNSI